MSRGLRVISTWSRLEPKFEFLVCPIPQRESLPLLSPPDRPQLAHSRPPSTSQTVATTDKRSPTTTGPAPPASPHPKPCSIPSVASTESKRQSRTAVVVRRPQSCLSTHVPDVLIPTPGSVYLGTHTVAGKEVAIKLQPTVPRNSPIRQESKIYKTLSGSPGIPWIMWSGKHGDFDVMILDLLGPSLEDLFKMCNKHFSLKTVLLIADQLVSASPHCGSLDVTRAIFPFWAALTLLPSWNV